MGLSSADIKAKASEIGFDLCGVAPAAAVPELAYLREWIDRGYAGAMAYMPRTAAARADARAVLPVARSVVVCAMVYNVDRPYSTELPGESTAKISRYAWGEDYHEVMKARLERLLAWMRERADEPFDAKAYVDTGPVQERVYAQYAGLGWIGKNACLINPDLGSWLFLSEILCSLPLEPDVPGLDHCGTCTLCLDACPTGALVEPGQLDARRCLSYLTIELRGPIPDDQRDSLGAHVYGCDICQEVCPWNLAPAVTARAEWLPREGLDRPPLVELWHRDDRELRRLVRGGPMTRAKIAGLRRNVAVAIGNSGDPAGAAVLAEEDPGSPSKHDPTVAEHVGWARRKLRQ